MGLRSFFGFSEAKALTASPTVLEAAQDRALNLNIRLGVSAQVRAAWEQFQSASYGHLYGHQPAVRKVVDFIATNIAQVGPKLYERVSDTEREARGDHPAAELLRNPNPWTPGKQFIFDVVGDFLVYNNSYVLKIQPEPARLYLLPVPASAVAVLGTGVSQVGAYRIYRTDGSHFEVSPEEMIHWRGYNASDRAMGISKLETLRADLSEQAASQRANVDLMESGLQQRGYIKRPLEAAEWHTTGGRDRFLEQFRAAMRKADRGYPILEEGMEIAPLGVSPKDAEMLASRKLFNEEVASQYGMTHCPPEGEEERKQFYADVLPPLTDSLCDYLKLQLLQAEFMEDDFYFEFDFDDKRMSDDRLKAITSAVGAPPLTRNEGRAMLNLPAKNDGDELITPLNVTVGGKPSPQVMPIQDPNKPSIEGDAREEEPKALTNGRKQLEVTTQPRLQADFSRQQRAMNRAQALLERFYNRQRRVLIKAAKFDTERWNRELAEDLRRYLREVVALEGGIYVSRLGGEDFDMGLVEHYLLASAKGIAAKLNEVTQRDFEGDATAREALERASSNRAVVAGTGIGTRATVFARQEAAKQAPAPQARMQVWVANTDRHADLDGAAVPLGSDWGGIEPGSEPNCSCSVLIQ